MQLTRLLRVDTFASARNELSRLFNTFTSATYKNNLSSLHSQRVMTSQLEKNVRRNLLHTSTRLKRLPSLAPLQSWVRGNVNLLLREARVRRNGPIALAALQVILSEERYIPNVEVMWLKDVLAACTSNAEVEQFKRLIAQYSSIRNTDSDDDNEMRVASKVKRSRIHGDAAAMLLGGIQVKQHNNKKMLIERSPEERSAPINDNNNSIADLGSMDAESKYLTLLASNEKSIQSYKEQQHKEQEQTEMHKAHVAHAFASYSPQPYAKSIYNPAERALLGINYLQQHYWNNNNRNNSNNSIRVLTSPNQSFIRYFQKQGIVRSETEVMSLFHAMQERKKFQSFRIVSSQTSCPGLSPMLHTILENRHGINRVDWLPASYEVYVLNCAEEVNYDSLLRNRQLLTSLSNDKVISFQSISSMMPVLFLQPELQDRILDLCAAPGGKTALILDLLASQREQQQQEKEEQKRHSVTQSRRNNNSKNYSAMTSAVHDGCVIANEADLPRAKQLASRLSRYKSSNPSLTITSVPGECFALSTLPHNIVYNSDSVGLKVASGNMMRFDKVLVDAPCSGEGTLGKDHQQWRLWHPRRSFQFVAIQLNLLSTAIRCCEAGGVVVYSTCTLNPIENEAVIAEILRMYGDCVELVEPSYPASHNSSTNSKTFEKVTNISSNNNNEKLNATECNTNTNNSFSLGETVNNNTNSNNNTANCFLPPIVLRHCLRSWFVPSREGGFYQTTHDAIAHNESIHDFYTHEPSESNSSYKKKRNGFGVTYSNKNSSNNNEECLLSMMFAPHCADEFRKANSNSFETGFNNSSGNETFGKDTLYNNEAYISEQLHRFCRRILPHDNNGAEGFFIAVLRVKRVVSLPAAHYLSHNLTHEVKKLTENTSTSTSPQVHNNYKTQSMSNVFSNNNKRQSVPLPSVSLLHTRGLLKLSTSNNNLIYTLLSPFFTEIQKAVSTQMSLNVNHTNSSNNVALPCLKENKKQVHNRISHFLSSQKLSVLWHRSEWMRFISNYTLEWLDQNNNWIVSSSSSQSTKALLETGVIVFTAQGELTWQGAQLLCPYITSHLFRLPLAYVQLLLAHRSLTLSDKIIADNSTGKTLHTSTLYAHRHKHENASSNLPTWWREIASELYVTESFHEHEKKKKRENTNSNDNIPSVNSTNNAIVEIDTSDACDNSGKIIISNSNKYYNDQSHRKHYRRQKLNDGALSSWCLPVKIECHDINRLHVTFHLLLDDTARHMCQALLNRFLSSSRHCITSSSVNTESVQNYLQKSQEYNVSNVMSPLNLYGANTNTHEVNRRLFANTLVNTRQNSKANLFNGVPHVNHNNNTQLDTSTVQIENEQVASSNNIVEI